MITKNLKKNRFEFQYILQKKKKLLNRKVTQPAMNKY